MHELPYEPPREGAGDSRRLARWAAAWTLAVFGLMGVRNLVGVVSDVLTFGGQIVLATFADGGPALGFAISALSLPLAIAAFVVWLVSGRVVVLLLASVPVAVVVGRSLTTFHIIADRGTDWSILSWLPIEAGYILLGLLFLTRTFRRAVNAPRLGR